MTPVAKTYATQALVIGIGIALALAFASFQSTAQELAHAGAQDKIYGWAWSSDDLSAVPLGAPKGGVGWISFNCTNTQSCASVDYGVTIDVNDVFSGYAWGSNGPDSSGNPTGIGWISFNSSAFGCPPGFSSCQAALGAPPGGANDVIGFARACSVFVSGCSGPLKSQNELGGWDGYISLNCLCTSSCANSYGVSFNTSTSEFSGYAWGGTELGWVSFNCNNPPGVCGASPYKVLKGDPPEPNLTLSASPVTVADGGTTALTWRDPVGNSGFSTCTAGNAHGFASWNGTKTAPPPDQTQTGIGPLTVSGGVTPYSFTLECTGPYGLKTANVTAFASPPDFTVSHDHDLVMVFAGQGGGTTATPVQITGLYNFSAPVTFNPLSVVPALPAGVTMNIAPPSISSPYSTGATLTITATQAFTGVYQITVSATGGGNTRQDFVTLTASKSITTFENF